MDDRDFVIEIAKLTPNPLTVENYYFDYIHPKIRYDKNFKLEFLKNIYLNDDVYTIKKELKCRLNLEMAATAEMQKIALDLLPDACCIVPEKREEVTTEGGLEVFGNKEYLKEYIKPLLDNGIEVSMFIAPDENQVKASAEIGAKFIELHTGSYSRAFGTQQEEVEFNKLLNATKLAQSLGLTVNAGHGLDYKNVHRMHEIPNLHELNIGHSIISRAIFVGLNNAVKEMKDLVNKC